MSSMNELPRIIPSDEYCNAVMGSVRCSPVKSVWLVARGLIGYNEGRVDHAVDGAAVQGHNKHHAFPGSAILGVHKGQADPC